MGRMERIKPVAIPRLLKRPGTHCDGGCLNLRVKESGAAAWVFRYMVERRAREMGLGPYPSVSLAMARQKAAQLRGQLLDGLDPIDARKVERATKRAEAAKAMTFKECAEAYLRSHRDGWRNDKHADQWANTLKTYAYPIIGDLPIGAIDTRLVMEVLEQPVGDTKNPQRLWVAKNETASRLRGRLEAVLGWATAGQLRSGDNPARWRDGLKHQLPARSKIAKVEHHAALPYQDIPGFMAVLRTQSGLAASALQLTILTGVRTSEALGAKWAEFDLDAKVWIIPAVRMKAHKEHRVPLSEQSISLLESLAPDSGKPESDAYVFPGGKPGRPLSNMSMLALLKRMDRRDLTVHGFRSTFRDWAAETTTYPRELAEMALAHTISSKVEAAYRRGDLFPKRALMMAEWAAYCGSAAATDASKAKIAKAVRRAKLMLAKKELEEAVGVKG